MFTHLLISIVMSATASFNGAENNAPCEKPGYNGSHIERTIKPVVDLITNLKLPKVDHNRVTPKVVIDE